MDAAGGDRPKYLHPIYLHSIQLHSIHLQSIYLQTMLFGKRKAAGRSRDAFDRHLAAVFDAAFNYAKKLTRSADDASDLIQTASVRAYEAFEKFDGKNFKSWFFTIIHNQYINDYRKKKRSAFTTSLDEENAKEPESDEIDDPGTFLAATMLQGEVESALAKLPDDRRNAIILCDIEGMSYEEIAEITQVPIGTVRSRISRGRAELRRALTEFALEQGYIHN